MAAARKDYESAIRHWSDYLERDPAGGHGWCNLSYARLMAGSEVPALRDAEKELSLRPACARAHLIAGVLYARKSAAKQALEHLVPAAKAYSHFPRVQLIYGRVLALSGDTDQAERVLRGILGQDRSHAEPYFWLGWVYARRPATPANLAEAKSFLRQALVLQPEYAEANLEIGRLYLRERQPDKALPHAERAVSGRSHYPAALHVLAQVYDALGRRADAARTRRAFRVESDLAAREKALLRRYAADPDDLQIALELGRVALARDKPEAALLFLRDAARRAPDDRNVGAALAEAEKRLAADAVPVSGEGDDLTGVMGLQEAGNAPAPVPGPGGSAP
jgi:tetratricopeptide (TPR) repeat protein